ncbi:hypothetical protein GX48_00395 [Paracoccidioides brasiliensis]|nr:hypothetical protein GX48_00395 [Paracoccidioides brasiliensis]
MSAEKGKSDGGPRLLLVVNAGTEVPSTCSSWRLGERGTSQSEAVVDRCCCKSQRQKVGDVGSFGSARLLGLEGGDWSAATLFLHVLKRVIHSNPSPTLPVLAWAKADLKEQRSSERDET